MRRLAIGFLLSMIVSLPVTAGEKLVIKGSNTYGELLGKRLAAAYQKANPGIEFEQESKGTGSGYAALLDGACDLAAASRPPNEDEYRLARSRGVTIRLHAVGHYGIAVVVNANNPVKALTDRQVREIFSGSKTRWSEVGGADQPVQVYVADPKLGTYLGFQELALGQAPYSAAARALPGYVEIADAVRKDATGIGYVTFALAGKDGLRSVLINGIAANDMAVNQRLYPYARQVWLASNARTATMPARRFVRFVQSRHGQRVVEEAGFIRVATSLAGPDTW